MNEHSEASGNNGASESLEIERKYEVGETATLPAAARFIAIGLTSAPAETVKLTASYLDTPERKLAAARLSVRHREGGHDAGWHLKERGADGTREMLWPAAEEVPEGLRAELRARVGGASDQVEPIATLRTTRTIIRVFDEAGAEVVEIADDRVHATDHSAGVVRVWREWEAELIPGSPPELLDRMESLLQAEGAMPSLSVAKIARATGALTELALASGANAEVLATLSVIDVADRLAGQSAAGNAEDRVVELRALASRIARGL
ncbi:MAG: CYTH domain-containing protein [Leucobacter sp.]